MNLQAFPDLSGYAPKDSRWYAIDSDSYDGAEDTTPPSSIGYGSTRIEALRDLVEIMLDDGEITERQSRKLLRELDSLGL